MIFELCDSLKLHTIVDYQANFANKYVIENFQNGRSIKDKIVTKYNARFFLWGMATRAPLTVSIYKNIASTASLRVISVVFFNGA